CTALRTLVPAAIPLYSLAFLEPGRRRYQLIQNGNWWEMMNTDGAMPAYSTSKAAAMPNAFDSQDKMNQKFGTRFVLDQFLRMSYWRQPRGFGTTMTGL